MHETYTLQALPEPQRKDAFPAIASLVAPGGTLLVIGRIRDEADQIEGPPWPLVKAEFMRFQTHGLTARAYQSFTLQDGQDRVAHVRCVFERPR